MLLIFVCYHYVSVCIGKLFVCCPYVTFRYSYVYVYASVCHSYVTHVTRIYLCSVLVKLALGFDREP